MRFGPWMLAFSLPVAACASNGDDAATADATDDAGDALDARDASDLDAPPFGETMPFIDTGPPPTLSVYFDDEDRRSSVGTGDRGVLLVQPKTTTHPTPIVDAAVADLHLRTWPELAEVSGAAIAGSTTDGTTLGYPVLPAFVTHVDFHPSASLDDRWYLLSFLGAPSDWQVLAPPQPGGESGMRFRPGSDPRLRSLYLETSAPTAGKVYLYFTENVVAYADVMTIVSLTQPGADTACTAMPTPIYDDTIGMLCVVDPSLPLQIAIGAGLAGAVAPHLAVPPSTLDFAKATDAWSYLLP